MVTVERDQPHRHLRHVLAVLESEIGPAVRRRARLPSSRGSQQPVKPPCTAARPRRCTSTKSAPPTRWWMWWARSRASGPGGRARVRFAASRRRHRAERARPHPVPAPATVELLRGAPVELGPIRSSSRRLRCRAPRHAGRGLGRTPPSCSSAPGPAPARVIREWPNVLRVMIGMAGRRRHRAAPRRRARDRARRREPAGDQGTRAAAAGRRRARRHAGPDRDEEGAAGGVAHRDRGPGTADALAARLLTETSSLGVRLRFDDEALRAGAQDPSRWRRPSAPSLSRSRRCPAAASAVPEFESVRAAAERAGRPMREVAEAAVAAFRSRTG
jgi:hypothetical protein